MSSHRNKIRSIALAACVVAVGVIGMRDRASLGAQSSAPTFTADVAPILYKNCTTCHRTGGLGPFSLIEYDSAKKKVDEIHDAVSSGYMPPWHADAPHGTFVNDRRLSDADKQTLIRWLDAGAPKGDPKALPKPPVYPSSWSIGTPDAVMTMPEAYTVPAAGTVAYQYFEVPTNFTEDKWVQSLEILPGAREVVHHVLVFARVPRVAAAAAPTSAPLTPGATSPARPRPVLVHNPAHGIPDTPPTAGAPPSERQREVGSLIGTTAPGTNVLTFPEGTALKIPAGSVLTFQMHYTAHGHEMKDRTSVGMIFAKSPPDEQILASSFQNGSFTIPAGATDYQVPGEIGFREPVRIWALFPHTHVRGVRWEYRLVKPDGTTEMILNVPKYDFNWQTYYMFAKPLDIPAGGKIESMAWYDNSAAKKTNPDPTKDVKWGDQTWEEMQYTGFLYTINSRRLNGAPPKQP